MSTTKTRTAKGRKAETPKADRFEEVTKHIVEAIEAGMANPDGWSLPWHQIAGVAPRNPVTKHTYTGGNRFWLAFEAVEKGFAEPALWASYDQWAGIGCQVRKGEKATPIAVPMPGRKEEVQPDGSKKLVTWVRFTWRSVFHIAQVDDVEDGAGAKAALLAKYQTVELSEPERHEAAEAFLTSSAERMGVAVRWGQTGAFYNPAADFVGLPARESFKTSDGLYGSWAHELVHATGATKRLARKGIASFDGFGSESYAFEELVAELGAAFTAAQLGLTPEPRQDHLDYLANWLVALKNDSRALWRAAGQAEKAVAFLAGESPTPAE